VDNPEIVVNLWYLFDELGIIYSLRARADIVSGADEEKLALLRKFSETDYLIAQPFPVPKRLHTTFVGKNSRSKLAVADHRTLMSLGGQRSCSRKFLSSLKSSFPPRRSSRLDRPP
jgi:hypothetical protein